MSLHHCKMLRSC